MILPLAVLSCSIPSSSLSLSTLHFLRHLSTQHIPYSPLACLFLAQKVQNRWETCLLCDGLFPLWLFADSLPRSEWCFIPNVHMGHFPMQDFKPYCGAYLLSREAGLCGQARCAVRGDRWMDYRPRPSLIS